MKTYFITGNQGKYKEITDYVLDLIKLDIEDIHEIQSLDINMIIKSKLLEAKKRINKDSFRLMVEDTGLYLNALNGFPGPLIKFMLKSIDNVEIFNLCDKLCEYKAKAITSFGVYDSRTDVISFYSAEIEGMIVTPKGNFGFGWDQIFIPKGSSKTFAEMETVEEKNKYSMRFKALQKLLENLG